MTQTASYTSATNDHKQGLAGGGRQLAVAIVLITLAGFWLRSLRINWQPLWWDEGYSVFFATEPLGTMFGLTAADIHPPLYYALLHGWIRVFGSAQPAVVRYASILTAALTLPAFGYFAHTLFPRRHAIVAVAVLLLAFNPMHLFYSQEVRMYVLALLLGVAATTCIVRLSTALTTARPWLIWSAAYVGFAGLLMHTLYYGAFLIAGHLLWAGWRAVRTGRGLGILALTYAALVVACLPWWLYAGPKLMAYVAGKVKSDQDVALTPWAYVYRHLVAMGGGHVPSANTALDAIRLAVPVLLIAALWLAWRGPKDRYVNENAAFDPRLALAVFVVVPVLLAYLANLLFPFFPEAGERLLLFVLPYLLLLIAAALAPAPTESFVRQILLLALLLCASIGVATYYVVPRYEEHDYRPIVADVTEQGTDADSVLALFPWQVGYWRAYTPQTSSGRLYLPQPEPVGQTALEWGPALQEQVSAGLRRGVLWFPEPRSFGSHLPLEGRDYLQSTATNLDETWYSAATLLSAWVDAPAAAIAPVDADWGGVRLVGAGVAPETVTSANQPIIIRLAWQIEQGATAQHVTLRVQDDQGRVWAGRDYEPIGKYAPAGEQNAGQGTGQVIDQVGLLVPVGMPPGSYDVVVETGGLVASSTIETTPVVGRPAKIATLEVVTATETLPAVRMPVHIRLSEPVVQGPAQLLGYSGLVPGAEQLAGTDLAVRLAYQALAPARADQVLALLLVDAGRNVVASYRGWPLPEYPVQRWHAGALVTVPAEMQTPAGLAEGVYSLYAGLEAAASPGDETTVKLAEVQIVRRPTITIRGAPQFALDPPVQFGSHAQLYGYDLTKQEHGYHLALYWSVLQALLPQHHIFVHLDAADGTTLAQADGPPLTAAGAAPTGSWLPGEQITTESWLALPETLGDDELSAAVLRVGLYDPVSETRLPATRAGVAQGDAAELPGAP